MTIYSASTGPYGSGLPQGSTPCEFCSEYFDRVRPAGETCRSCKVPYCLEEHGLRGLCLPHWVRLLEEKDAHTSERDDEA